MKKITLLLAGLLASGIASADQFPNANTNNKLLMGNCTLLNEDVNINLTTGVVAGVDCSATRVAVAACHTAGMVKTRTVGLKTIQVDDGEGGTVDQEVSCTIGDSDPDCEAQTVQGPAVANATTQRGTVSTSYPNSGSCANAGVPESFAGTL